MKNLPSESDILKAIYAAVHHKDRARSVLHKKPKEQALYAFYTPIKVFLELPFTCEVAARFGTFRVNGFEPGVPQEVFEKIVFCPCLVILILK